MGNKTLSVPHYSKIYATSPPIGVLYLLHTYDGISVFLLITLAMGDFIDCSDEHNAIAESYDLKYI